MGEDAVIRTDDDIRVSQNSPFPTHLEWCEVCACVRSLEVHLAFTSRNAHTVPFVYPEVASLYIVLQSLTWQLTTTGVSERMMSE